MPCPWTQTMTQTAAESPAKKGDPASTQRDGHRLLAGVHRSIRYLKIPCKPHHAHCANAIPIQIELVPCETVTGRLRFGVVVIMPASPKVSMATQKLFLELS